MKYEVSPFNFVEGVLREGTVLTEFGATCPKLSGYSMCINLLINYCKFFNIDVK